MDSLKSKIIEKAKSAGFAEVKFANYQTLDNETDLLKIWINNGYHADMNWIERHIDLRKDPRKLLDSCQSMIIFAHSYNNGIDHLPSKDYGKIARYAQGRDYHKVLKKKLKKIIQFIDSEVQGSENRAFVDSGPVAERDWAVLSGIGARGKNSLILNKKLGSYFFLSVILSSIKFPTDEPISDMCGKCTKCISACPTDAIVKPYVIDSNKCISYQTIENRSDNIPQEISDNISNWIFGCDICQEVCPWNNHRNMLNREKDFQPRNNTTQLELKKILNMEQDEFIDNFAGQAIIRTKLSGLKRNAKSIKNNKL